MGSGNVFVYGTLLSRYFHSGERRICVHPRSTLLRGYGFEGVLNDYKLFWYEVEEEFENGCE